MFQRRHKTSFLRSARDVLKTSHKIHLFLRCFWDVLKTSQKRHLFWDVSKKSLRYFFQWRSDWDLSETASASWDKTFVTYFSSLLPKLHNAWLLAWLHASSWMASVAHHNPYINFSAVYLLMQELFADKIHFFKFLSISDKPWLDKLKIIIATRGTSFSEFFHWHKEGEYQQGRGNTLCLKQIQSLSNLSSTLKFLTP